MTIGSGKDNIFHGFAAKLLDTLLTHYPSERINNIALAASIRTNNGGNPLRELYAGFFMKRFKARNLKFLKFHTVETSCIVSWKSIRDMIPDKKLQVFSGI